MLQQKSLQFFCTIVSWFGTHFELVLSYSSNQLRDILTGKSPYISKTKIKLKVLQRQYNARPHTHTSFQKAK